MVVRFTVFMGTLLGVVSWVLLVPLAPKDFQASPGSSIGDVRNAGLMPMPGDMKMSAEIGHEVFEVPGEDAEHMAMLMASGGGMAGMEGMEMGAPEGEQHAEEPAAGMQMGAPAGQPMAGMEMGAPEGEQYAEEPAPGMQMGAPAGQPMAGMEMSAPEGEQHAEEPAAGMQMGAPAGQPMAGMEMGAPEGEHHAGEPAAGMAMEAESEEGHAGGAGLMVLGAGMAGMASRTVEIEMAEWHFTKSRTTVKAGETIRFVVRNSGNIPHEFMFMPGAAMAAVNYRLERADWNLLEHEAPFERAIILPGDSFEVVMRITQPGTWMYMCMFPYHMQLGMMGVMTTEGAASGGMGGMKM